MELKKISDSGIDIPDSPTLKKIGDNEWEIPKEGKMNVPVKIFASEKLLEKMKEDITLQGQGPMSFLSCAVPKVAKWS